MEYKLDDDANANAAYDDNHKNFNDICVHYLYYYEAFTFILFKLPHL